MSAAHGAVGDPLTPTQRNLGGCLSTYSQLTVSAPQQILRLSNSYGASTPSHRSRTFTAPPSDLDTQVRRIGVIVLVLLRDS